MWPIMSNCFDWLRYFRTIAKSRYLMSQFSFVAFPYNFKVAFWGVSAQTLYWLWVHFRWWRLERFRPAQGMSMWRATCCAWPACFRTCYRAKRSFGVVKSPWFCTFLFKNVGHLNKMAESNIHRCSTMLITLICLVNDRLRFLNKSTENPRK